MRKSPRRCFAEIDLINKRGKACDGATGGVACKRMSVATESKSVAGGLVTSNPRILGGTPVFGGTRLPVQALFDYLADGLSLDYFLETFEGVTREQAKAVLRYGWERMAAELAR